MDGTQKVAINTIKIGKQALVFNNSKSSSEKCAEDLSKLIYFEGEKKPTKKLDYEPIKLNLKAQYEKISNDILSDLSQPTKQCLRLAKCVKKGIAFHHSGLTPNQRKLVEKSFRAGLIKVISSTPTLAAGLDMPAYRVILRSLKRFTGRGLDWINVLEYLQMSGRAGRPGKEDHGESIAISSSSSDYDQIYERFICGKPEAIYSKLAVEPILRTYVLSLLSTGIVNDYEDLIKFFKQTFWAYQFGDVDRLIFTINKVIKQLNEWDFLISKEEDFVSANKSESKSLEVTTLGHRVAQLYIDPLTAHELINSIKELTTKDDFNDLTLLNILTTTMEMKPLLNVKNSEFDLIHTHFEKNKDSLVGELPDIYDEEFQEFLKSFKTSICLNDWIDEIGENRLLTEYNITPGDLKAKNDKSIWLLYCMSELAKLTNHKDMVKHFTKLSTRIKYGVKAELVTLLRMKGIGRIRARTLFNNGIKDLGDLKKVDNAKLSNLIGEKLAKKVKEQLGLKFIEAKRTLLDF